MFNFHISIYLSIFLTINTFPSRSIHLLLHRPSISQHIISPTSYLTVCLSLGLSLCLLVFLSPLFSSLSSSLSVVLHWVGLSLCLLIYLSVFFQLLFLIVCDLAQGLSSIISVVTSDRVRFRFMLLSFAHRIFINF